MRKIILATLVVFLSLEVSARAQNYTGTYLCEHQGKTLTLVLEQNSRGRICGFFKDMEGERLEVTGFVQEGVAMGTCYEDKGGFYFEAFLNNDKLNFYKISPGEDNMPDYNTRCKFEFTRVPGSGVTSDDASGEKVQARETGAAKDSEQGPCPPQEALVTGYFCCPLGAEKFKEQDLQIGWLYFNGESRFVYGGKGSRSAAPDGQMPLTAEGGGAYLVRGDEIVLLFEDGEERTAKIVERRVNGSVSEICLAGRFYISGLCN